MFPWYNRAQERPTKPGDCFKPKEMLESLQGIEREPARNPAKYPATWLFWKGDADATRRANDALHVLYLGRSCRLFSDEQGVWAVETDPGPREGIRHDLKGEPAITARIPPDGRDVTIAIERVSLLSRQQGAINRMKAVCLKAMEEEGLVMTQAG